MKVLISVGYGAGWSTWNDRKVAEYMRTYKPIIDYLESGNKINSREHTLIKQLEKECKEKFGEDYACVLGWNGLCVEEAIPPFKISEYDGFESIDYPGNDDNWIL